MADERKKIKVTINGTVYEPIVTLDDNLDIMGIFFYTHDEREAIKKGLIRVADVELASRLEELLRGEQEALKAELERDGKTLPDEEFSKELNGRLHQRIGESAIARISFDKGIRYDLAARMTEVFRGEANGRGIREVWYDTESKQAGIRLTPTETSDFILAIFTAFPPQEQLQDVIKAKGLSTPVTPVEPEPEPIPVPEPAPEAQIETVAVEATTVETYEPGSLGYQLKAMGTLTDEQIAAMVLAAEGWGRGDPR